MPGSAGHRVHVNLYLQQVPNICTVVDAIEATSGSPISEHEAVSQTTARCRSWPADFCRASQPFETKPKKEKGNEHGCGQALLFNSVLDISFDSVTT